MENNSISNRRRKKISPLKGIQSMFRNSFSKDIFNTPPSPVKMISFVATHSPPVINEDHPLDFFKDTKPEKSPLVKSESSPPGWSSDSSSSSSGIVSDATMSNIWANSSPNSMNSSIYSIAESVITENVDENGDSYIVFNQINSNDIIDKTTNAYAYTTIRRKRGIYHAHRKTRSQEGFRQSWELEDWERESKSQRGIRHTTYSSNEGPNNYVIIESDGNQQLSSKDFEAGL